MWNKQLYIKVIQIITLKRADLIFRKIILRILNSTLPLPQLRGVEMPTLYTVNNLLVDTVVNIINIINKYDSTILIYFLCFFLFIHDSTSL